MNNTNKNPPSYEIGFFLDPPAGLEPATSWLTVMRSTDWAKEEYDIGNKLPIKRNRKQYVSCFCYVSTDLFSRAVASQVSSALQSLTSVFGMGTGGPSVT